MLLGGLQKVSLIDYPGHVAATVFAVGCNFSCPFCHNPELVRVGSDRFEMFLPEEDFFNFLENRRGMIEGVCVTGGEPTLYSDLSEFIRKIKKLDFLVKLDTNGSMPDILKELIDKKLIDYIAMDIKGPLEKYNNFANADINLEDIHRSTEFVRQLPDYEFRTTVVPGLHTAKDFLTIAHWLEGSKRYFLQQFRPGKTLDSSFSKIKPFSDEELAEFCQIMAPYFESCELRT